MDAPPTTKQLRYLRLLAKQTATGFTPPRTRAQASREIERRRRRPVSSRTERHAERRAERRAVQADLHTRVLASAVRADEISGYGSSARWASAPEAQHSPSRPPRGAAVPHRRFIVICR